MPIKFLPIKFEKLKYKLEAAGKAGYDKAITFAEWGYLGKGKFQRRDFRLDTLTQAAAYSQEGTLFANLGKHELFTPITTYPPLSMTELAAAAPEVLI